jgi:hypothetical protein
MLFFYNVEKIDMLFLSFLVFIYNNKKETNKQTDHLPIYRTTLLFRISGDKIDLLLLEINCYKHEIMKTYTFVFYDTDMEQFTIEEENFTAEDIRQYIIEDPEDILYAWDINSAETHEQMYNIIEVIDRITKIDDFEEMISEFNDYCFIGEIRLLEE